ncbi:MAG TPA: sensor histidine kinase, partial [Anaerolineae bacterium]|nr:sensor histidine kinase [Anaerolineae bacterium]
ATTMQLSTAKALLEIDPERAKVHIAEAEQLAKSVQKELSGLIEELRPAQLEGQGLFAAVHSSAEIFTRRHSIPVDVRLRGKRELPLTIEQPMFRILQEAFNHIAKHSQATQVTITLSATNDTLSLVIHDNGVGFNQADAQGDGIGLHSMQERITQINGKLKIKSSPENGTTISAECPIRKDEG